MYYAHLSIVLLRTYISMAIIRPEYAQVHYAI